MKVVKIIYNCSVNIIDIFYQRVVRMSEFFYLKANSQKTYVFVPRIFVIHVYGPYLYQAVNATCIHRRSSLPWHEHLCKTVKRLNFNYFHSSADVSSWGKRSKIWADYLSTSILCVCEQRMCADLPEHLLLAHAKSIRKSRALAHNLR